MNEGIDAGSRNILICREVCDRIKVRRAASVETMTEPQIVSGGL